MTAGFLAGLAVLLLLGRRPRLPRARPAVSSPSADTSALLRWRPLVTLAVGIGGWAALGGVVGVVVAAGASAVAWRVLGSAEGPAAAERRARLARDLPAGVDLLVSCLQGGAAVEASLLTVADALGGPLAEEFRAVHHRLALGLDPASAWRESEVEELRPLARAVLRAHESGAGIADTVVRLAADLREQAKTDVQARASAVEVRAAGPLAACFLPAFVLLAVVPLVVGSVSGLQELLR